MTNVKFCAVETLPETIEKGVIYITSDGSQYVGKSDNTALKITDIQFVSFLPFVGIENKLYVLISNETIDFYIWNGVNFIKQSTSSSVDIEIEEFIAYEGQTIFNLSTPYEVGKNRLRVKVGNVPQHDSFIESSNTSITFKEGLYEGAEVIVEIIK